MMKYFIIFSGLAVVVLMGLWIYVLQNSSGHTGLNPNWLYLFFLPLILFGVVLLKNNHLAILLIIFGIAGSGSLIYLDKTNTLLEYDIWVERCMMETMTNCND